MNKSKKTLRKINASRFLVFSLVVALLSFGKSEDILGKAPSGQDEQLASFVRGEVIVGLKTINGEGTCPLFVEKNSSQSHKEIESLLELSRDIGLDWAHEKSRKILTPLNNSSGNLATDREFWRTRYQETKEKLSSEGRKFPKKSISFESIDLSNYYLVAVPVGLEEWVIEELIDHELVVNAEPNYLANLTGSVDLGINPNPPAGTSNRSKNQSSVSFLPNDTFIDPDQNGLWESGSWGQSHIDAWDKQRIKAHVAWQKNLKGQGTIVAVLDSGLDILHTDIHDNVWVNEDEFNGQLGVDDDNNGFTDDIYGFSFAVASQNGDIDDLEDIVGHGTFVAGTLAAKVDDNYGLGGTAPETKLMVMKVTRNDGSVSSAAIADAFNYAPLAGAQVTNSSFGALGSSGTVLTALRFSFSLGVFNIAGSGNNGGDADDFWPAKYKEAMSISATEFDDSLWPSSNTGSTIEASAPGAGLNSARGVMSLRAKNTDIQVFFNTPGYTPGESFIPPFDNNAEHYRARGTSVAAPQVSGLAAIILGKNPLLTNEQARHLIRFFADDLGAPGHDPLFGDGRINVSKAASFLFDCNGNGMEDSFDISNGLSLDCNGNGIPDGCDISVGLSKDVNSNNIPDECEVITFIVDDDAVNDPGPGDPTVSDPLEDGSVDHPFDSIEKALAVSQNNHIIELLDGTYTGVGNKNINPEGLAITIRSQNGADNCILDGQGAVLTRFFSFINGEGSGTVIEGLTLTGANFGGSGAAIECLSGSSPLIKNCIIKDSISLAGGGAIHAVDSSPIIEKCIIANNSVSLGFFSGGGINLTNSSAVITHCTIVGNTAGGGGGGINIANSPGVIVTNSIVWNNSGSTTPNIKVTGGSPTITYSNIGGGFTGTGNIDVDPLFVDEINCDFHLTLGSLCIDAGDPTSPFDPDNTIADMGALFFDQTP